jgi:hypothetical protein
LPGFGQFHQRQRGEDPHEVLPEQHGVSQRRHQVTSFFLSIFITILYLFSLAITSNSYPKKDL